MAKRGRPKGSTFTAEQVAFLVTAYKTTDKMRKVIIAEFRDRWPEREEHSVRRKIERLMLSNKDRPTPRQPVKKRNKTIHVWIPNQELHDDIRATAARLGTPMTVEITRRLQRGPSDNHA